MENYDYQDCVPYFQDQKGHFHMCLGVSKRLLSSPGDVVTSSDKRCEQHTKKSNFNTPG